MPRISTYLECARSKFGGGHLGEVRSASDMIVGAAGCEGSLAALAAEADIPALLRKGPSEALGSQSGLSCDVLTLRRQRAGILLKVNRMGHSVLSVGAMGDGPPRLGRGPKLAASFIEWAFVGRRPDPPNGGLQLLLTETGF